MRTPELKPVTRRTDQKVVLSTTIFTLPGSFAFFVNVGSMSIGSSKSSVLSTDTESWGGRPGALGGGGRAAPKIPAAAAWVSVGELSVADGPLRPLELRAMRMWDGFTDMGKRQ
jgi:hypothetical protein